MTGGFVEVLDDTAWQSVDCDDCGSSWDDVYTLTGRENVRRGGRVEIATARQSVGVADADLSTGATYGSPDSPLSVAYDMGRNYGERVAGFGNEWSCQNCGDEWNRVTYQHCDECASIAAGES